MSDHLFDILHNLLSHVGIHSSNIDNIDFTHLIHDLGQQGIDLTQYTVDEIKHALDYALGLDGSINQGGNIGGHDITSFTGTACANVCGDKTGTWTNRNLYIYVT